MNGNTAGNGLANEADAAPTASGEGNMHNGTDGKNEALSREEQQSELDSWAAFYACPVVSRSLVLAAFNNFVFDEMPMLCAPFRE